MPSYTPPCILDTPAKVALANKQLTSTDATKWKLGDKCWYWGEEDAPWNNVDNCE